MVMENLVAQTVLTCPECGRRLFKTTTTRCQCTAGHGFELSELHTVKTCKHYPGVIECSKSSCIDCQIDKSVEKLGVNNV